MADLMRKIEAVAAQQRATKVVGVRVRLGALAHISAGHLREHFRAAARRTLADGARLDICACEDESDPHAQDILLESIEVAE